MTDTAPASSSTVAIIGGGVMGGAIAAGVRSGGWPAEAVTVADRNTETLADLAAAHGLKTTTSLAEAAAGADVIVFAVKPQDAAEVLAEFGPHVKPGSMLLTVAAGLPASFYEARLPAGTRRGAGDAQHARARRIRRHRDRRRRIGDRRPPGRGRARCSPRPVWS